MAVAFDPRSYPVQALIDGAPDMLGVSSAAATTALITNAGKLPRGSITLGEAKALCTADVVAPPFSDSAPVTGSKTWDPPSVAAGANTTTTVPTPGAVVGAPVSATFSLALPAQVTLLAQVTATDTVTVTLLNGTAGAVDLGSGTLSVRAARA